MPNWVVAYEQYSSATRATFATSLFPTLTVKEKYNIYTIYRQECIHMEYYTRIITTTAKWLRTVNRVENWVKLNAYSVGCLVVWITKSFSSSHTIKWDSNRKSTASVLFLCFVFALHHISSVWHTRAHRIWIFDCFFLILFSSVLSNVKNKWKKEIVKLTQKFMKNKVNIINDRGISII